MANEQNLRPGGYKFTKEDYEKSQASRQENAKRKKDICRAFEVLLEKGYINDGVELTGAELIALKQFEKAKEGDTKAFEVVRDTVGQKPSDKVVQVNVDAEYQASVAYVRKMLEEEE